MSCVQFEKIIKGQYVSSFVNLEKIMNEIATEKYRTKVDVLRENVANALVVSSSMALGEESKLPRFDFSQGIDGYTGFILLSLPVNGDAVKIESLRNTVNVMPQTVCSFLGSSGRSMKVVMKYQYTDGTLPKLEADVKSFHSTAYLGAARFLQQITGIVPDKKVSQIGATCRMSADSNAYFNPDALPIMISALGEPTKETQHAETEKLLYDGLHLPGYDDLQMQVTKFNFICRKIAFSESSTTDDTIISLANECRKAGLDMEIAVRNTLRLSHWQNLELLVRTSFENAYCNHPLGVNMPINANVMQQQLLFDFLKRRYVFRRNVVTGSVEYIEHNRYILSWRPLNELALNTICIAAHKSGIDIWAADIKRYVDSDLVNEYDPIKDWLRQTPQWDGVDRVGGVG